MRFKPRIPRELIVPAIASIVVVGFLVYVAVSIASMSQRLDRSNDSREQLQSELDAQEKTSEALARQVKELGGKPIVEPDEADEEADPDESSDTTGEISKGDVALAVAAFCQDTGRCRGEDGDDATPGQVAVALSTYCDANGDCRGRPGRDGDDGPPPSEEAITDGVEAFCADGACVGRPGRDGRDGTDGKDSTIPGPKGDTGSSGRNFAGLSCNTDGTWTVYYTNPEGTETVLGPCFGRDGKDSTVPGPPGKDGKDSTVPGPKGEPGRGIESLTCAADGTWIVTYTDGTSSTTPGPCRVEQPIEGTQR